MYKTFNEFRKNVLPLVEGAQRAIDMARLIEASNLAVNYNNLLVEHIEFLRESREKIAGQLIQHINYIQQNSELLSLRLYSSISIIQENLNRINFSPFVEALQRRLQISEEESEAFLAAGWIVAPSMSDEFRQHIVDMHREGKTRYISRAIIGYYQKNNDANLMNAIEQWKSHPFFFPQRATNIDDAIYAHVNRRYTLSVLAFIQLQEGILREHNYHNLGDKSKLQYSKLKKKFVEKPFESFEVMSVGHISTVKSVSEGLNGIWDDLTIEDEIAKPVKKRRNSRHTISHGIAIDFGTQLDSLKHFLILDAISVLTMPKS